MIDEAVRHPAATVRCATLFASNRRRLSAYAWNPGTFALKEDEE
jgi:hypothetical protein